MDDSYEEFDLPEDDRSLSAPVEPIPHLATPPPQQMMNEIPGNIRPSLYETKLNETTLEIARNWLELYQTQQEAVTKAIKEQVRLFVPICYSPSKDCDCLKITYDEELAFKKLFGPMELFLSCFQDTDKFFERLKALEPPPTLCGRVFRTGEPTYSCRDCGLDPTCVLCVDCFQASSHRHHKYRISLSSGGGYCDCGDTEAWRSNSDSYCDHHVPNPMNRNLDPAVEKELEDIQNRAQILFNFGLEFCHDMLTMELLTVLPRELTIQEFEVELLKVPVPADTFQTVLYNDETHTFELVITTLTRAVDCTKRTAIDFATMIDRDGRSVVKCSDFQTCHQVRQIIERQTSRNGGKPLRVTVMQSYVVAHQTFAMKLLAWIQKLVNSSSYYRKVFCNAIMMPLTKSDSRSDCSILENLLQGELNHWKSVRSLYHHLAISALLKDYDTKKTFSVLFAKLYPDLMRDFIEDDHDHSCSITSLSVQLFTVPTIAHHLIEHEDIFLKIITSFMSEYEPRRNADGILEFDRNTSNFGLKRATFCIIDLKYILTCAPQVWTDGLRRGFLHGFSSFVSLLSWMENMDSVVRQTAQHMEYEPEWESGFNLHMKLTPVIWLVLEWCGSDRNVLIASYRRTLTELGRLYGSEKIRTNVREYADHSATCIDYDVSRQPVSVHKPVSRLLAGLFLHLEKQGLDAFSSELNVEGKPTPEQIIEPALRTQVLVGQVHANMWKRNGFALLHQIYFYHNVKCRSDMLDKDIISLQMGAAIIESNEFLLHLLDRYGLYQYVTTPMQPNDGFKEDDNAKHTRLLAEEFLQLIIVLFSARYTPGVGMVTKEDCIKKEIIQLLCIEPYTHSSLNKALVENVNLETGLETVINEVADFKKQPTQNGSSLYELKPELYSEYDCNFPHYSREEQSKAEQRQQARKKAKGEPEIFPPPKLPLFTSAFNMVVNILKSDVMMQLMNFILKREVLCLQYRRNFMKGLELWQMSYSDPQVQKVLHLICLGLNEEIVRNQLEPGHFFRFSERATTSGLFTSLEDYVKSSHAHMVRNVHMVRHIMSLREIANPPKNEETFEIVIETNMAEEEERLKKAKLAAESRSKMLAKISAAQKTFMAVNADLFAEDDIGSCDMMGENLEFQESEGFETCQALGSGRTPSNYLCDDVHVCILCQEEQSLSDLARPFALAAYVQRSSVLCQDQSKLLKECDNKSESYFVQERDALFLGPDLLTAPYVSCCGHVMHVSCWNKHYESVLAKERRRPYRNPMSFDVDKREYLCPMCDSISNVVIPMTNPLFKLYPHATPIYQIPGPFEIWIEGLQVLAKERNVTDNMLVGDQLHKQFTDSFSSYAKKFESCSFETIMSRLDYRKDDFVLDSASSSVQTNLLAPKFTENFQELVSKFVQTVFSIGLDVRMDTSDYRIPLMLWQGLSYTIITLEEFSRDQNVPFFGSDIPSRRELCLTHCVRTCAFGTMHFDTTHHSVLQSHAIKLITTLVTSPAELPCLLEVDAFTMLINLTHALPVIRPNGTPYEPCTGTMRDFFICRLMLLFHVTQVLVTKDFSQYMQLIEKDDQSSSIDEGASSGDKDSDSTAKTLPALSRKEHLFSEVWRSAGKSLPKDAVVDYEGVWESIRLSVIPFLRCCAKFYEKLTGVSPSQPLTNPTNTYDDLVKFLGLPTSFEKLFDSPICWQFPYRWASHPGVRKMLVPSPLQTGVYSNVALVTYPRREVVLAPLPQEYVELINSVSMFTCNKGDIHDSRAPTMCLICGAMLCSQSYCCQSELGNAQVGACTHHAYYCGAGKGIFLRIRDCKLFYIGGRGKGCYVLPPYVDEYGETDQGLKRGNPMNLCAEKYQQLRRSWMLHLIPEEIARIVENSSSISTTEWQHF